MKKLLISIVIVLVVLLAMWLLYKLVWGQLAFELFQELFMQ